MEIFSHWKARKELDDDATISTTRPKKSPTFFGKSPTFLEKRGRFFEKRPLFFLFLQHLPQSCWDNVFHPRKDSVWCLADIEQRHWQNIKAKLYFQNRSVNNPAMRNVILIFNCYFCHAT